MSDLTQFLDHCRRMVKAHHRPDCNTWTGPADDRRQVAPDPACPGCVTDGDRVLWRQLAREHAAYLGRPR